MLAGLSPTDVVQLGMVGAHHTSSYIIYIVDGDDDNDTAAASAAADDGDGDSDDKNATTARRGERNKRQMNERMGSGDLSDE